MVQRFLNACDAAQRLLSTINFVESKLERLQIGVFFLNDFYMFYTEIETFIRKTVTCRFF
jgi:hypothetical protein